MTKCYEIGNGYDTDILLKKERFFFKKKFKNTRKAVHIDPPSPIAAHASKAEHAHVACHQE